MTVRLDCAEKARSDAQVLWNLFCGLDWAKDALDDQAEDYCGLQVFDARGAHGTKVVVPVVTFAWEEGDKRPNTPEDCGYDIPINGVNCFAWGLNSLLSMPTADGRIPLQEAIGLRSFGQVHITPKVLSGAVNWADVHYEAAAAGVPVDWSTCPLQFLEQTRRTIIKPIQLNRFGVMTRTALETVTIDLIHAGREAPMIWWDEYYRPGGFARCLALNELRVLTQIFCDYPVAALAIITTADGHAEFRAYAPDGERLTDAEREPRSTIDMDDLAPMVPLADALEWFTRLYNLTGTYATWGANKATTWFTLPNGNIEELQHITQPGETLVGVMTPASFDQAWRAMKWMTDEQLMEEVAPLWRATNKIRPHSGTWEAEVEKALAIPRVMDWGGPMALTFH